MNLLNKSILITGAGGGIGRALALQLAKKKVHFILPMRRPDSNLAESLKQAGALSVELLEVDLSDEVSLTKALSLISKRTVDVLINNAGLLTGGLLENQDPVEIQKMFQVNLLSAVQLTRAILPQMLKRDSGLIVNNSSVSGKMSLPCATTYAASKAGLVAFTESLRRELKGTKLQTLLLITPGIKTRMFDRIDDLYGKHISIPMASISADDYASQVIQKMESDSPILMPKGATGFVLKLALFFPTLFDRWVGNHFSRS